MDKTVIDQKKETLIEYVGSVGIPRQEVETYFGKEYRISSEMGMNDENSLTRALISTVNYYRKVLDKMGNRITFLCLGVSQPTDYGLGKKLKDLRFKWKSSDMSEIEKSELIEKGIVNQNGIPLHTADTTYVEAKIGSPIILEDEYSQSLVGVVETDGKIFPALVKVYGKKECDIPKIMYTWCSISADQSQASKPEYVILNSRELGMKVISGKPNRITLDEYKSIVEKEFSKIIFDVSKPEDIARLDAMIVAAGASKVGHVFLKNVIITPFSAFAGLDASTEITSTNARIDVKGAPIIADMKVPSCVPLDVDTSSTDELWLLVLPRENKNPQSKRMRFDALGMYIQTPIKKEQYKANDEFFKQEDSAVLSSNVQPVVINSVENQSFYNGLFK